MAALLAEEGGSPRFAMRSTLSTACLPWLPVPVQVLLRTLEETHPATAAHGRRVASKALRLAEFSHRCDALTLQQVLLTGYLHDLGKIAVPASILDKAGELDAEEWEAVRMASICGESMLKPFFPPGAPLVEAVRSEHERWDGGGYPDGLCGEQIPLCSRIVLIADTLDALQMHTAYRHARGLQEALKVLAAGAGTQFDPEWVELAVRLWSSGLRIAGPAPTPTPSLHSARQLQLVRDQRRAV